MARRSGLGKGLGALIPTTEGEGGPVPHDSQGLVDLPVDQITANRYQPRGVFDEETLDGLTESIRALGVLQPILVRPIGDQYELVAGERRWRAAKRAGLATIPSLVRASSDLGALEHALVENLHRDDLNALEEAAAYQQLMEDFQLTQDQVAQRVGKNRSTIANLLRLFQLPPTVQKLLSDGSISAGHARALLGTPDRAFQEALARRTVAESLNVRQVEQSVRERQELGQQLSDEPPSSTGDRPPKGRLRPPGLVELEDLLSTHLDTRIQVSMGAKRGKLVIEFADLEDLERIYRVIAGG